MTVYCQALKFLSALMLVLRLEQALTRSLYLNYIASPPLQYFKRIHGMLMPFINRKPVPRSRFRFILFDTITAHNHMIALYSSLPRLVLGLALV